jgi:hypothetical protein
VVFRRSRSGRVERLSGLFDIVEERKRNAGGGVLAVRGNTDTKNAEVMRFMKPSFDVIVEICLALVNAHRPSGGNTGRAQFFKLESLILAQNERWRQA